MSTQARNNDVGKQGDLLLWVAGGVVAAVGVAWLVIMKPWAGGDAPVAQAESAVVVATAANAPSDADERAAPEGEQGALDNPLHMAELAYQAGMLVEPEEYSAWTLYSRVVKSEPGNSAALEGLKKVADDLVRRGETALEQGRFDDARATVERIRVALPAHAGAKALGEKIWPAAGVASNSRSPESFKPEMPVQQPLPKVAPVEVAPPPPAKPAVDPIVEANQAFEQAMAASRLLTPVDQSAKHFVEVLVNTNPNHDTTRKARERLSREFLSRATQSLEALDIEAAGIWIDEAEAMGIDGNGVRNARSALTDQQIALESAKPLPASALKIATYVAPVYPQRANERRVEGWVDVEFTILPDGTTRNVTVANASHDSYFRREAVAAVEQWKFEPRIFMNRPIEQRSYTRIRFVQ
jgi:periplasmic protein TonB